jgi:hypothetical protein
VGSRHFSVLQNMQVGSVQRGYLPVAERRGHLPPPGAEIRMGGATTLRPISTPWRGQGKLLILLRIYFLVPI